MHPPRFPYKLFLFLPHHRKHGLYRCLSLSLPSAPASSPSLVVNDAEKALCFPASCFTLSVAATSSLLLFATTPPPSSFPTDATVHSPHMVDPRHCTSLIPHLSELPLLSLNASLTSTTINIVPFSVRLLSSSIQCC
ncbi:hypothetical protein GW17_00053132 [Ensete ventricosum]|nr:hypothetical protein GW17_00053132 [Ensete ventricosum]